MQDICIQCPTIFVFVEICICLLLFFLFFLINSYCKLKPYEMVFASVDLFHILLQALSLFVICFNQHCIWTTESIFCGLCFCCIYGCKAFLGFFLQLHTFRVKNFHLFHLYGESMIISLSLIFN